MIRQWFYRYVSFFLFFFFFFFFFFCLPPSSFWTLFSSCRVFLDVIVVVLNFSYFFALFSTALCSTVVSDLFSRDSGMSGCKFWIGCSLGICSATGDMLRDTASSSSLLEFLQLLHFLFISLVSIVSSAHTQGVCAPIPQPIVFTFNQFLKLVHLMCLSVFAESMAPSRVSSATFSSILGGGNQWR